MKLLLHVCCAPCSTVVIKRLQESGYELFGLFYNPNIQPEGEYRHRLKEAQVYSEKAGIELIEGDYESKRWNDLTKMYAEEPEGGKRCKICFQMRLKKTAQVAEEFGFQIFTTALSISPYKDARLLNEIGERIANSTNVAYLASNFKKQEGYKKSMEMCREHNLYRQDYCGCEYSRLDKEKKEKNKKPICNKVDME